MPIWIQKLSKSGGQYRVTLPKNMIKNLGLEKARVVEMWGTEGHIIHIKEYHGKKSREGHNKAGRTKTN